MNPLKNQAFYLLWCNELHGFRYYRIISMEKQQNMPSGYEKNRKIIGKYQSFH